MKKLFGGVGNLLYLIKPYWKYGRLYLREVRRNVHKAGGELRAVGIATQV